MYAVFFGFSEARVFDYRIAAFPQFTQWLETAPAVPLYSYRDLDERLLYYAQRDIPVLDDATLQHLREDHASLLLLVENSAIEKIAPLADCKVKTFTPYLKKHKSLAVFGFGDACGSPSP